MTVIDKAFNFNTQKSSANWKKKLRTFIRAPLNDPESN